MQEEGCGVDTASYVELLMADKLGFSGKEIMFSSNNTPADEFVYARELGATINLDAYEDIAFLKSVTSIPKVISCRYNPGGVFELGTDIMDNPEEAKFGMTKEQLIQAFIELKELGVEEFGIHALLASNTVSNDYYPELARQLFELAVEVRSRKQVSIWASSTSLVELGSITSQSKNQMILPLLGKACTAFLMRFSNRQDLAM